MSADRHEAASVVALRSAIADGALTAAAVLDDCLARIAEREPVIHAVIALDTGARQRADEPARTARDGPLLGIPVLVKDNIAVTGMPTTAGSRALRESSPTDAPLVTRLREAGAVVFGKTNMTEWANFRASDAPSGWSAVGGQTCNPHVLDRTPSGSSSGSAAAVAAGLAPVAIGTETDGSILAPAGTCGVVGLKPTVAAIPAAGIVPLSPVQDVAGPITRTVADAAVVFAALTGRPTPALTADALRGPRLGLWLAPRFSDAARGVVAGVARTLEAAGAVICEVDLDDTGVGEAMHAALLSEFRHAITGYLRRAPRSRARTLRELVAFNAADPVELAEFGQDTFELALRAPEITDPVYRQHRNHATTTARTAIDSALRRHHIEALLTITNEPAPPIKARAGRAPGTSTLAAAAGYPAITVPAGALGPLPIGLSLIGTRHSEPLLLQLAYAVEQATHARPTPALLPTWRDA